MSYTQDIKSECVICLVQLGTHVKTLPCGHRFDKACLVEYFSSIPEYKCPMCRNVSAKFNECSTQLNFDVA